MFFLRFENVWTSQNYIIWLKELGTMSLDESLNTIASFELSCHIESLQFSLWCWHNDVIIFPKVAIYHHHYRVTVVARVPHSCILRKNSIFNFNLRQGTSWDLKPDLREQNVYANHLATLCIPFICVCVRRFFPTICVNVHYLFVVCFCFDLTNKDLLAIM